MTPAASGSTPERMASPGQAPPPDDTGGHGREEERETTKKQQGQERVLRFCGECRWGGSGGGGAGNGAHIVVWAQAVHAPFTLCEPGVDVVQIALNHVIASVGRSSSR